MAVQKQVDFNSISSYKNCSKKFYEIHVCMPPKNTVVINKLEQAATVSQLGGKTYFTAEQIEDMQKTNPQMLALIQQLVAQGKAYAVTEQTPFVLCGTLGELWLISADKLANTYTFLQNNQPLPINQQSLNQRMTGNYLDWTSVRTSHRAIAGQNMACFVPVAQKGQIQTSWGAVLQINGPGVSHGKGDFIVCQKMPNGQPNLADRWVVNGDIFAATYNNQGWTDCISSTNSAGPTIGVLPKLVPTQQARKGPEINLDTFMQKCQTLMKELEKVYKFKLVEKKMEAIQDYTGFAQEVKFSGDTYVAKFIVQGKFSRIYSVKDKATGQMTERTVTATETSIWFACSTEHKDSAIAMSINPHTDGLYLAGWAFPHASNTKATDPYWSCKTGTISDINCAEEVKLFVSKCNGRDAFIDNRKKPGIPGLEPNGLFKKFLDEIKKRCHTYTKKESTITVVSDLTTIDKLPRYKDYNYETRKNELRPLVNDINYAYKHFISCDDAIEKALEWGNVRYYLEKIMEALKEYKQFAEMPIETLYKDVLLKAEHKYCFYAAVKADKDAEFEKPSFCFYIPIEFTDLATNKPCCLVIKFSDVYYHESYDRYELNLIKEPLDYHISFDLEEIKLDEAEDRLLTDREKLYKTLSVRVRSLDILNRLQKHYKSNLACNILEDKTKSLWYNAVNDLYEDYMLDGFYSSELAKKAKEFKVDTSGDFLIVIRLFSYIVCESLKKDDKFFKLHPIKDMRYEEYNGHMRTLLILEDNYFYQAYNYDAEDSITLRIGKGDKTIACIELKSSMFKDCYSILDAYEKNVRDDHDYLNISANLYKQLENTVVYKNIKAGMEKFMKPRKPDPRDCVYILKNTCGAFAGKLGAYGINILKPFRYDTSLTYDDITIDGDNDNHLTLHFKLDLGTESWGIKISGKTNNNTLSYTHIFASENTDVKETDINEVVTEMIEKDVCEYLGVSKWKRFTIKETLKAILPFEVTFAATEGVRRSQITSFSSEVFNTQFKLKCTPNELLIISKTKGIPQTFEAKLEGDITANTPNELSAVLMNLALNGVKDATMKEVINILANYTPQSASEHRTGGLLKNLKQIEGNTLKFEYCGYKMSSSVLPDGTVSSISDCIGDNFTSLPIADFPQAVVVFDKMSYYYTIH